VPKTTKEQTKSGTKSQILLLVSKRKYYLAVMESEKYSLFCVFDRRICEKSHKNIDFSIGNNIFYKQKKRATSKFNLEIAPKKTERRRLYVGKRYKKAYFGYGERIFGFDYCRTAAIGENYACKDAFS